MDERASEQGDELDVCDEMGLRKTYTPPRLTRWGTIPRITAADPDDGSGIPV
jgi:hypothetical protein